MYSSSVYGGQIAVLVLCGNLVVAYIVNVQGGKGSEDLVNMYAEPES